jgi:predicted RNA binding protein YcfA (HicA-like mRNA interferase family)
MPHYKPLSCRLAEKALLNLGFIEDKKRGTSHRQFRKILNETLFKVTLDCHRGEVTARNIKYMSIQAGVSRSAFYEAAKQ